MAYGARNHYDERTMLGLYNFPPMITMWRNLNVNPTSEHALFIVLFITCSGGV